MTDLTTSFLAVRTPTRTEITTESAQTLKPKARSWSRPSSVIISMPHGGSQTQLMTHRSTSPSSAVWVWSSITSVSGQAAEVSVMSMVKESSSSRCSPPRLRQTSRICLIVRQYP